MPDSSPQLDLGVQPTCTWQGQVTHQLRSVHAWEVLRQIALSPSLAIDRKAVSCVIWPDVEEHAALQRLRQTLLYIKQGLPHSADWLIVSKSTLRIDPSKVTILGLVGSSPRREAEAKESSWVHPFFSFTSGLDWESRRSAVLGIVSAAFAVGQLEDAVNEMADLRRLRPNNLDLDLILAEADFCQTLYRMDDTKELLDQIPDDLTPRRKAKKNLVTAHWHLRTDNAEAALPHSLNAFNGYSHFQAINPSFRAGLCLVCSWLFLEKEERIPAFLDQLSRLISQEPANEWQGVLTWLKASCTYPSNPVLTEVAAKQLLRSKLPAISAIHLARAGHDLFGQGHEKFGSACCHHAVNQLAGTDLRHHEAEAQTYLAEQHRLKGRHKEALVAFSASLRLRRGGECQIGLGTSLRGAGMSLLSLKDYEGAFDRLSEAYRAFEKVKDEISMATVAVSLEACKGHLTGQKVNVDKLRISVQLIQQAVKSPFIKSCLPEDLREAERLVANL